MKQWCEFQGKVQFQNTLLVLECLSERQGAPGTKTLVAAIPRSCTHHMWGRHHKELSHLYIPDSHLQLIRSKATEKIFIINHESNETEIFLISRNEVKHCPFKPFLFDINL